VWDVNRAQVNEFHPTQKPTALAERAMCNNSQVGNIVLDLFLGSGATLIAAEQLNRRCFGMEISPAYCDVIVARWEKFTGQKAELEIDSAHPKADNPS
jgi:DNA modification methylase